MLKKTTMIEFKNVRRCFKYSDNISNTRSFFNRNYKYVTALDNISFKIRKGEQVGILGPNGAGKSSIIKIMCGILAPNDGDCIIDGLIPWKNRVKHVGKIGAVFGHKSQLWWDIPIISSFKMIKEIYKINSKLYDENLKSLVKDLDISQIIKKPLKNLSLGERMRCEIAAVLLRSPKLLFMDEPTIGLDVVSKDAVRKIIKKECETKNITLVLTSHDMKDIEYLTNRIILIGNGKILKDIALEKFLSNSSNKKIITIKHKESFIESFENLKIIFQGNGTCVFELNTDTLSISTAVKKILSKYDTIFDISISNLSSEKMLISLYKGSNI